MERSTIKRDSASPSPRQSPSDEVRVRSIRKENELGAASPRPHDGPPAAINATGDLAARPSGRAAGCRSGSGRSPDAPSTSGDRPEPGRQFAQRTRRCRGRAVGGASPPSAPAGPLATEECKGARPRSGTAKRCRVVVPAGVPHRGRVAQRISATGSRSDPAGGLEGWLSSQPSNPSWQIRKDPPAQEEGLAAGQTFRPRAGMKVGTGKALPPTNRSNTSRD